MQIKHPSAQESMGAGPKGGIINGDLSTDRNRARIRSQISLEKRRSLHWPNTVVEITGNVVHFRRNIKTEIAKGNVLLLPLKTGYFRIHTSH